MMSFTGGVMVFTGGILSVKLYFPGQAAQGIMAECEGVKRRGR